MTTPRLRSPLPPPTRPWQRACRLWANRGLTSSHAWLRHSGAALQQALRWESVGRLNLHAQALTYDTLLALVPLLAVIFAVVRGFGGMHDVAARLEALLVGNLAAAAPVQAVVGEYIHQFVSNSLSGKLGALSVVILVFSVLSLLSHIETSFNTIFATQGQRPLLLRLLTYWAVLTCGPVLLAASFALTAALQTSAVAHLVGNFGLMAQVTLKMLPLGVTWLALTAMYALVPNTPVRLRAAITAAVMAGSLWNGAKFGYAFYAKNALTLQNIYGSLVAIPLFIFWLYVSWLLVLLGAAIACALHTDAAARTSDASTAAPQSAREHVACRLMLEVARDFDAGLPPSTLARLSAALACSESAVAAIAHELLEGGLLRAVAPRNALVPGRDLTKLSVADILTHLRHPTVHPLAVVDDAPSRYFQKLLDDFAHAGLSLARAADFKTLVSRFPHPPS